MKEKQRHNNIMIKIFPTFHLPMKWSAKFQPDALRTQQFENDNNDNITKYARRKKLRQLVENNEPGS
jgi:hypothetical protein